MTASTTAVQSFSTNDAGHRVTNCPLVCRPVSAAGAPGAVPVDLELPGVVAIPRSSRPFRTYRRTNQTQRCSGFWVPPGPVVLQSIDVQCLPSFGGLDTGPAFAGADLRLDDDLTHRQGLTQVRLQAAAGRWTPRSTSGTHCFHRTRVHRANTYRRTPPTTRSPTCPGRAECRRHGPSDQCKQASSKPRERSSTPGWRSPPLGTGRPLPFSSDPRPDRRGGDGAGIRAAAGVAQRAVFARLPARIWCGAGVSPRGGEAVGRVGERSPMRPGLQRGNGTVKEMWFRNSVAAERAGA